MKITKIVQSHKSGNNYFMGKVYVPKYWIGKKVSIEVVE